MGFLDDIVSDVGQSLEQSVRDYAKGQINAAVGGTMAYLFGDQETGGAVLLGLSGAIGNASGLDPLQIKTLQSGVDQQAAAISWIGNQLQFVAKQVQNLTGQIANIEQLLGEIGQELKYIKWADRNGLMLSDFAHIDSKYSTYAAYMADPIGMSSSHIADLAKQITDSMGEACRHISYVMLSQGNQDKGALELWSEMVTLLVAKGLVDYREAVSEYMDYYSRLTYAQLRATNLLVEAYHYQDFGPVKSSRARRALEEYKGLLLSQEDQFIKFLFPLVVAGATNIDWHPVTEPGMPSNPPRFCFTAPDAAMQLHPGIQWLRTDPERGKGYYAPSSVFMAAEKLLANLYVTDPTARRIAVHMVYGSGTGGSIYRAVNAAHPTLDYWGQGNNPIAEPIPPRTFPIGPDPYPTFIDFNFNVSGDPEMGPSNIYLNRLVYATTPGGQPIPDGVYTLTNLNGHDGLLPIETYGWKGVPFQQPQVVDYKMQIGPASPFDFMNFAAYTMPVPCFVDQGYAFWGNASPARRSGLSCAVARSGC
jgi:hypothetical protein